MRKIWGAIRYFFPINLLLSHVKHNVIMLFFWMLLFALINGRVGAGLGVHYLFLSPEYLGTTSPLSFLLLGFGIGGFIMAFHIYSYVQIGPKYPFIATLSRPFYKFSANNNLIPYLFLINLCVNIYYFQVEQEQMGFWEVFFGIGALVGGTLLFNAIALLYFMPTNKDLYRLTGKHSHEFQSESSNIQTTLHKHKAWYKGFLESNRGSYYYLTSGGFRIKKSRSTHHYDAIILNKVFTQNHINASVFEIILLGSFFIIGLFRDYSFFQVPSGVSIMMLLTIGTMVVSALFSWFKEWTIPVIISIVFLINFLGMVTDNSFKFRSYAFGLSYEKEDLIDYTNRSYHDIACSDSMIEVDLQEYYQTLNNWKEHTGQEKPKLVIINTSGGGLRSATWTFKVLQDLDSITQKDFLKQVQMITGASGGMIGAAYYRDLMLMEYDSLISSRLDKQYLTNITKDLLNRISFSIATNDLFLRFKKVDINGHEYVGDRGYEFEEELKSNLNGAFDRTLGEYENYERNAVIPSMIFTPTIVNDGRRLLIGAQHHGYLQATDKLDKEIGINPVMENVDYQNYFANNNPENIRFTTVLRMSATFPYILPMVSMPTSPSMYVMDAGIRDNYGMKLTAKYILNLNEWIKENTSGVVIIRIRDRKKDLSEDRYDELSLISRVFYPLLNMSINFPRIQDFNQDELFSAVLRSVDYPVNIVTYNLREEYQEKISLSWHLTSKEKEKIFSAVNSEANKLATRELLTILGYISEEK